MLVRFLMKRTLQSVAILIILAMLGSGCARMPTTKRSASVIKRYFKKYGKKYPTTVYGMKGIKEVEVTGQEEIHKHKVAVESFVTLGDSDVERIYATLEKGPFGWKFISWEVAQ